MLVVEKIFYLLLLLNFQIGHNWSSALCILVQDFYKLWSLKYIIMQQKSLKSILLV